MPTPPSRVVIVGASLGGASAAVALRELGFDGEVLLIGAETHLPYERPPLSKAVLLGDTDEPDWVKDADHYPANNIGLLSGTVATVIDRERHVVMAGSEEYPYDRLLLATGSTPRRLPVPGADLEGIVTLRTLDDSLALRKRFTDGARIVIVGAGWIGCEAAAAARKHGATVTVLAPDSQPLVRVVGEKIGAVFADLHREHGVDLRLGGAGVHAFTGESTVESVQLSDGGSVPADTVLVGIGVKPNVELAETAGLELADQGIAVNAALQTSDPDIFAVGDIAAHDHPHYPGRIRVEHWAVAKDQGAHVAANLLGADKPYELRPFFFSDQYDLGCEYRGQADPEQDQLVVRGDLAAREFTAFWLRDGRVIAAMNVNQWDETDTLQELVDSGAPLPPD
jgi:3-phenylpropionate/trans-cinnamate dioxygenase ferredoxin reductase component